MGLDHALFPDPKHDHRACIEAGLEAAERICEEKAARLTPDRRQVLEILLRRHTALGAYDIIDSMDWGDRKRASSVVYRALDFLAKHGLVHKLHSRNAFVACSHPDGGHGAQFLICTDCDRIAEIADRKVARGIIAAARDAGFTVQRPMIEVEGLCPHCGG
jgi:Fur family zinc uptake transcriptional regulator